MNVMSVSPLLKVSPYGPVSTGGEDLVHLRQGDLDGACGTYCLVSALIAYGVLDRTESENMYQWDGRSREGRFRDAHKKLGVLMNQGTFGPQLVELISVLKAYGLSGEHVEGNKKQIFNKVHDAVDKRQLPIIGVKWQAGGAHWMLVVGYQSVIIDGKTQLTHLLCLDPGQESPKTSLWNAVLDVFNEDGSSVNQGRMSSNHWGMDGASSKCQFQDAVIISY